MRGLAAIQKSRVFRFLSSVRLAVPLMLVIGIAVACGTLYEARYNAEVASLEVYGTTWFQALMLLLWINIFCAALSRYPYRLAHLGFVTTHAGLLTLLIGAAITARFGIDGKLRVVEGQAENTVVLRPLVLKVTRGGEQWSYPFARSLIPLEEPKLRFPGLSDRTGLVVLRYLPFVGKMAEPAADGPALARAEGPGVAFRLQSAFFDVSDRLSAAAKPETRIGPARIRLVTSESAAPPKAARASGLLVQDAATGRPLARFALAQLMSGSRKVQGVELALLHSYQQGVVNGGRLSEGGSPGANPAVELRLRSRGKTAREVSFARYPGFALNENGAFGLKFKLEAAAAEGASEAVPADGNVIEFRPLSDQRRVRVVLRKNGAEVLAREVGVGEPLATPWMGMKITVSELSSGGTAATPAPPATDDEPVAIELPVKSELPPGAIQIAAEGPGGAESTVWIPEGESREVASDSGPLEVYFGPETVKLPFSLALTKFRKTDYPGTDTAIAFESDVGIRPGAAHRISMNEPLKEGGYLIYQSSYELERGRAPASIFSVNRDPGRTTKYAGAVILCIGIALFTGMRSRLYHTYVKRRVRA